MAVTINTGRDHKMVLKLYVTLLLCIPLRKAEMRKKNGQTLNTGKAVIPASNRISRSYTITITIPKIRIKVPKAAKVLANAMQKKRHDGIKPCRSGSRDRWANPGKLFPKFTSIMSHVFGDTKRTRNNVFYWNAISRKNHRRGYKRLSDVKCDDAEDESPLALGKFLGLEMKQGQNEGLHRKVSTQPSFSAFLNKKLGLKFTECKVRKVSFGGCTSANGVFSSHKVMKKHPSFSANTFRSPSKMLSTRRRNYVKRARSLSSNVITKDEERGHDEERAERDNWELCKKRILMGAKCKPLNFTGYLRYDKDGILVPDLLF